MDNLAATSKHWDPTGLMARHYQKPLATMVTVAMDIWPGGHRRA